MINKKTTQFDYQNKRRAKNSFRNNVKRKNKKYDPNRKRNIRTEKEFQYSHDIERFISSNKKYTTSKNQQNIIDLSDDFCLFNNPSKVLFQLVNMLAYAKSKNTIELTNKGKGKISFGALYLLDNLCWEIGRKKLWRSKLTSLTSEDQQLFANLKSVENQTSDTPYAYIINSRIRINREDDKLAKQIHREKSTEIRALVKKGINDNIDPNYDLSPEEHTAIDSAISEHFDNILSHAPTTDYGQLCGVYHKANNEVIILIYNFGNTIYESMTKETMPDDIKKDINGVIENHTERSFFITKSKFTKENALTLLALQEGISSKLTSNISRGHGLMDFIQHCFELNSKSKIRIISGKTAIKIDSKYKIEDKEFLGRTRRILALNTNNDIFEKPDEDYVSSMNITFPGVLIETIIPLTKENEDV